MEKPFSGTRRKSKSLKKPKYDNAFKKQVVLQYLQGRQTMKEVGLQFRVSSSNVCSWYHEFSAELAIAIEATPMTEQEQKELNELKKQNEALNQLLKQEQMRNFALETMIDLATERLDIDIRKNSGAKQPNE
jgi:transposase-like protein